jgi:hypothetical protein
VTDPAAFRPLDMGRRLRDDPELSNTEKLVLLVATLRTNKSGRVRASFEILAKDASLSTKSVSRVVSGTGAARYLQATRHGRRVDLDWLPDGVSSVDGDTISENGQPVSTSDEERPLTRPAVRRGRLTVQPSASSSASSSATSSASERASVDSDQTRVSSSQDLPRPGEFSLWQINFMLGLAADKGIIRRDLTRLPQRYRPAWVDDDGPVNKLDLLRWLAGDSDATACLMAELRALVSEEELREAILREPPTRASRR